MLENTISLNSSAFAGVDEKCCETGILIQLDAPTEPFRFQHF